MSTPGLIYEPFSSKTRRCQEKQMLLKRRNWIRGSFGSPFDGTGCGPFRRVRFWPDWRRIVVINSFVPTYRATYLLIANDDYVVFKGVMPVMRNLSRSERSLIYNPIVLDPVLSEPGIRSAPSLSDPETAETNLIKNLSIGSGGTESTLAVSYTDSDPEAARMVCNAIVESYLRQRDAFDNKRVSNLEDWLEPEIQTWELEVEERKRKVEEISKITVGNAQHSILKMTRTCQRWLN